MPSIDSRISARSLTALIGSWRTSEPAYEALADAVRLLQLDNRIAAGTGLPAERELAAALGLSRTSVAGAYRSLRESGHIQSVRGSGSVTLPLRRGVVGLAGADGEVIDLQQASPAAWPGLAGLYAEAAREMPALLAGPGYDTTGRQSLREKIAQRYSRRGLPTEPDQILVTTGAQAAIFLLATVLVARGDRVVMETPTYPHAAEAFRRVGGRPLAVPVSVSAGWDTDRAAQAFARAVPSVAYLMPDHHNPTGRTMDAAERTEMEFAAARAGATVIVDETTSELTIDPVPGLGTGFADAVRVGSLGKTAWGGLRVGWIRADAALVRRLVAARVAHDLGTPEFEQVVAARVVDLLDDIAADRGRTLREGRDRLRAALRAQVPEWDVPLPAGGVSLWLELDASLSGALVMEARAHGLFLSSGPRFAVDGGHERRLRVPFTAAPETLERAAEILADCWARVRASGRTWSEESVAALV